MDLFEFLDLVAGMGRILLNLITYIDCPNGGISHQFCDGVD